MKNLLSSLLLVALFIVLGTGFASAQFPIRPTEYTSGGYGCSGGYDSPTYAYDDNFSTASTGNVFQPGKGSTTHCETWYGFPSASGTNMMLNVNTSAQMISTAGKSGGEVELTYSIPGVSGNTFYLLMNSGQITQQTYSVPIPDGTDLTQIQVKGKCWASVGYSGYSAQCIQQVYEIWISGS